MNDDDDLAAQFEMHRGHLMSVAYRMLGSSGDAEDAVQETWLRLTRSKHLQIENLGGWLTVVVSRVCLDALRARAGRREESMDDVGPVSAIMTQDGRDPAHEIMLSDSVSLALLVVLERLTPAERIAFVLHDVFDMSFDDVALVVDRTPVATRQLASRARRRVCAPREQDLAASKDVPSNRRVVEAFLTASRDGDLSSLIALLNPDAVFHADAAAVAMGGRPVVHGAAAIAAAFNGRARGAEIVCINDDVGLVVAPLGKLKLVLRFEIVSARIVRMEAVADQIALTRFELRVP